MSAGLIEAEALKGTASEIVGAIRDEAEKSLDEILKDRLESHRSDKEAFAELRKSLSELCEVLQIAPAKEAVTIDSDNQKNEQELQQRKMVLIIDELDRCRLSFALSILEHIKHFFSVDGVYFILVTSLNHLHSSVKFAYGDIDARSYLEKFYHIRVQFPTSDIARPDLRIITFSRFIGCNEEVSDILYEYDKINHLSLRTVERIITYFKIIEASVKSNQFHLGRFSVPLCVLKVMHPQEYSLAREGRLTFEAFNNCMRFELWKERNSPETPSRLGERTKELWEFVLGATNDDSRNGQFASGLVIYGLQRDTVIPYFCRLIDGLQFAIQPQ